MNVQFPDLAGEAHWLSRVPAEKPANRVGLRGSGSVTGG